ncbi:sugar phosphate isomerase/epimerase family protein [Paenibacillus sp. 1001270B_150601_E10]|uniref:sugar phosphate isomerase/epimerase family protein n=1 Tax=Paenibacillus sp. 1001270B_150601_E10 TaxID=2787079 RepID=UPI00189EB4C6|nr:sugar phosphate isomerase/epimerase family protein [Paenibacillus sp. 1001270B_150601_E10]
MEFTLSMWSVHRTVREHQWTVIDFLSFCHDQGIHQVELLDVFWKDVDKELPEVIGYLNQHNIKAISYAVTNDFVSQELEARQAALDKIRSAFPIAASLGASVIRVFSGNLNGDITYEAAQQWIVEGLSAAAKEAESLGLTLCLENHGQLAGTAKQVQSILEQVHSPALKSTFDTGNFLLVDEEPLQALNELLPFIEHVHLKDFTITEGGRYRSLSGLTYEGRVLGEGVAQIEPILRTLKANGYSQGIVLEYEGLEDERAGIQKCLAAFEQMKRRLEVTT